MSSGKIITVYPLIPSSGSKYTATEMACRYRDLNPTHKIAILDLNLIRPFLGYGFLERVITGRNNLDAFVSAYELAKDSNEGFSVSAIKKIFAEPEHNLFILAGSRDYNQRRHIRTEHISFLLEATKSIFDVIFVSVASDSDNPGTVVSLSSSWKVVIVGKHNHTTFESFVENIEKITPYVARNKMKFVYNHYDESLNFHFGDFIILYDMEVLGCLYYDKKTIDSKHLKKGLFRIKGLFKSKLKNDKMISEIVRNLMKK